MLTKVDIIVPRIVISVSSGSENNFWLPLVHISEQDQSLCRGDPPNPGLLKRNLYDIGVTHKYYSQITGDDEIASTRAHIHRASPDDPFSGGLLFLIFGFFVLFAHCTFIPANCNFMSNHTLPSGKQLPF